MKPNKKLKTWESALTIPKYLVHGISDAGTFETYDGKELYENDDLRLAICVSGGHKILVPTNGRVLICENGDIEIEVLV